MKPHLIGLSGYAQVGKSSVGQILAEHGYEQRAFADKLRELAWAVFPDLAGPVRDFGYEWAKQNIPYLRDNLVALGAGCRKVLGADVWVDALLPEPLIRYIGAPVVITDVRYANEALRIKQLGGEHWHIERLNVGPANEEEGRSIALLPRADRYIHNTGGLEMLKAEVERVLASY